MSTENEYTQMLGNLIGGCQRRTLWRRLSVLSCTCLEENAVRGAAAGVMKSGIFIQCAANVESSAEIGADLLRP